jgi:hypothetical protein
VVGRESNHPDAHETFVQVERLQRPLCGGSRPHFFRGVATVRPQAAPDGGPRQPLMEGPGSP